MKPVAVITGVAGGIGSATARVFAEAGWKIIGIDLPESSAPAGLDHFVPADLTEESDVIRAFEETINRAERIDALINNAAVLLCKPLLQTNATEWDYVMAANVRSIFLMVRYGHPLLRKAPGCIVNVSSVHSVATSSDVAAYAASKGAVLALTRALAIELAPDRIRVNAILPGAIDTPMLRDSLTQRGQLVDGIEANLQALGERHILGRIGKPEEIANAILFLSDPASSSFITGQTLVVDGGAIAHLSTE
jgi:NAD(P)-dependent dehydrogenase (short-subunit alcohol dehydrogenase family)